MNNGQQNGSHAGEDRNATEQLDTERSSQERCPAQTAWVSKQRTYPGTGITASKVSAGWWAYPRAHGNATDETTSELCAERQKEKVMPAGHMTEEEYAAFKKQAGFKEPQKVTTFYKECQEHEAFMKHHADRRALNRTLRFQQCSIPMKLQLIRNSGRRYDGWPEH